MRKRTCYQRPICLWLCLVLVLGLLSGCEENVATTMRLEKHQGTVGVEDNEDKRLQARDGMQLYSGYEVGTAEESLAWIGLDQTKAVKLDALSTAEITQIRKMLKLQLHEGKLFFHVSQPLEEDETFTIETSTMVTGIRGTTGWVEVVDAFTSRVYIVEGSVEVQSYDPETDEIRTTTVTSGQILTVVYHGSDGSSVTENSTIQGMIGSNQIISDNIILSADGLRLEEFNSATIPDFVLEEIRQSQQIQESIQNKTELSLTEILQGQTSSELLDELPENAQQSPPDVPEDAVEELPEDAEVQEPPAQQPQTPNGVPYITEEYYEKVTVEWYEAVPVDPNDPNDPNDPGAGNPSITPPEGSDPGTGTPNPGGSSGGQNQTANTSSYRPIIDLVYNGLYPAYATVTHADEVTTYTPDASGNLTSSTDIVPRSGTESITTPAYTQPGTINPYYITFENPDYDPNSDDPEKSEITINLGSFAVG